MLECVILHCEFSRHRAPSVYRALRRRDRQLNGIERFPSLYLPELYVMQSGYATFHATHPQLCEPHSGAYVSMLDRRYQSELKRDWKQRKCGGVSTGSAASVTPTHLISAAILTRATSESSALNHSIEHGRDEQLTRHDSSSSPPMSPMVAATTFSPLSSSPTSSSVSSFHLPPPLHLNGPAPTALRINRRRPARSDGRLMRSASCAALRQPLSFNALDTLHTLNGVCTHNHNHNSVSSSRLPHEQPSQPALSAAAEYEHSSVSASVSGLNELCSSPSSLPCLFSSSAAQPSAQSHSTLCVQQVLAL